MSWLCLPLCPLLSPALHACATPVTHPPFPGHPGLLHTLFSLLGHTAFVPHKLLYRVEVPVKCHFLSTLSTAQFSHLLHILSQHIVHPLVKDP